MATRRDPYGQFNFLVDLGGGAHAGFRDFQVVAGDGRVTTYRDGSAVGGSQRRVPGLNKSTDVTLKRGVMRAGDLEALLREARAGTPDMRRTVTIRLQNEDHTAAVRTWTVHRSLVVKVEGASLPAKGNEVDIEALTLCGEGLEVEDPSL